MIKNTFSSKSRVTPSKGWYGWIVLALVLLSACGQIKTVSPADTEIQTTALSASFQALGYLPEGESSYAKAVSADGSVVVGESYAYDGQEAFFWTEADGMVGLGDFDRGTVESSATDVSADGSVIVGWGTVAGSRLAFRWTLADGLVSLGSLKGGDGSSAAYGTSADGSVMVGQASSTRGQEVFRQVQVSKMKGLGDLPFGGYEGKALDVSENGSVVVGWSKSHQGYEAFRHVTPVGPIGWTPVMEGLGDLPGGGFMSFANAVSADGQTIVGQGSVPAGLQAFRWTSAEGMVDLGPLTRSANAVSANGNIIVGTGWFNGKRSAFIWDETNGVQELQAILASRGLSLLGWSLERATGVSANGSVIVGAGVNPEGETEAWRVWLGPQRAGPGGLIPR